MMENISKFKKHPIVVINRKFLEKLKFFTFGAVTFNLSARKVYIKLSMIILSFTIILHSLYFLITLTSN